MVGQQGQSPIDEVRRLVVQCETENTQFVLCCHNLGWESTANNKKGAPPLEFIVSRPIGKK